MTSRTGSASPSGRNGRHRIVTVRGVRRLQPDIGLLSKAVMELARQMVRENGVKMAVGQAALLLEGTYLIDLDAPDPFLVAGTEPPLGRRIRL